MAASFLFSRAVALVLSLLIVLSLSLSSSARPLSLPLSLPHGAACTLGASRDWAPPFCEDGVLSCLVSEISPAPAPATTPTTAGEEEAGEGEGEGAGERQAPASRTTAILRGTCHSNLSSASYCAVGPFNFAVGVRNISSFGPSSCESCSCTLHADLPTANKARCDCDPLPPCYIEPSGATLVGHGCPYSVQSNCVITVPRGGPEIARRGKILKTPKFKKTLKTHLGRCQAPQVPVCVSAGRGWGPYFYAVGTNGMVKPGDACSVCSCGEGGVVENCTRLEDCSEGSNSKISFF